MEATPMFWGKAISLKCKYGKEGKIKCLLPEETRRERLQALNPMKHGLSPKISTSMSFCFLLTDFVGICFPLLVDLWITACYSNCS